MAKGDKQPRRLQPPIHLEVSGINVKKRVILLVICIAVAIGAIAFAMFNALNEEPGWQKIQVSGAKGLHCGDDFSFYYDLGADGRSATEERKQLTVLYTQLAVDAYQIFTNQLSELSAHPNEPVTVDPSLYHALSLVQEYKDRSLFLGPVYAEYDRIFTSEIDGEAASFDPSQSPDMAEFIAELVSYANDPEMVDLELLEDNQVTLKVSEEYSDFLQRNEITRVLSFGWMKNAFIADFLADKLQENGFTCGYIASFDGYTRNLDTRQIPYSLNVFDRFAGDVYIPATMQYNGPISIVSLRNYPMTDQDKWNYYVYSSGRIVTGILDPMDGMCKSSTDNLIVYGKDAGCAQITLQIAPVFATDSLDVQKLLSYCEDGLHSVWFEDMALKYTDEALELKMYTIEGIPYTKSLEQPAK